MTTTVLRHLSVHGPDVSIELTQRPGARQSAGRVQLRDATTTLVATELGVLQTADKWATFTARVRQSMTGEERSALLIVEHADPFDEGRATVTIALDGGSPVTMRP